MPEDAMFSLRLFSLLLIALCELTVSMQARAQFQQPIVFFAPFSLTAAPTTIDAGQSATISFTGTVVYGGCDVCIFSNTFTDQGLVTGPSFVEAILFTILSGDGDSVSGTGGRGSAEFTYENPGVYHPSVSGTLHYTRAFRLTRLSTGAVIDSGVDSFTGGFNPATTAITVLGVPEPETAVLLAAGLALLLLSKRSKKRSQL